MMLLAKIFTFTKIVTSPLRLDDAVMKLMMLIIRMMMILVMKPMIMMIHMMI